MVNQLREGGRDAETEVTSDAPAIAADQGYLPSVTDLMSNEATVLHGRPAAARGLLRIPGVADYLGEFTRDACVAPRNNLLSGTVPEVSPHDLSHCVVPARRRALGPLCAPSSRGQNRRAPHSATGARPLAREVSRSPPGRRSPPSFPRREAQTASLLSTRRRGGPLARAVSRSRGCAPSCLLRLG